MVQHKFMFAPASAKDDKYGNNISVLWTLSEKHLAFFQKRN